MFSPRSKQRKEKRRQQLMSALENLTLTIAALTAIVDSADKPHAADAIAALTTRLNTANGITPPAPTTTAT